ncbi:MAG: thioredoxin domain-containing protein [Chlamydiota bacterium]
MEKRYIFPLVCYACSAFAEHASTLDSPKTQFQRENASVVVTASKENASSFAEKRPVQEITTAADLQELIHSTPGTLYVDFYSPTCSPCKRLHPRFQMAAKRLQNQATFARINVSQAFEVVSLYSIGGLPSLLVFEGGEMVFRKVGLQEIARFLQEIEREQDVL